MASEGKVHIDQTNEWHMQTLKRLCDADPEVLLATKTQVIDVTNESSVGKGCQWWLDMTGKGGEGMVIKPMEFVAKGNRGLLQPAIKCRGREYLRIIYGPEYTQSKIWNDSAIEGSGENDHSPFGNLPLASKRWSDLSVRNH